MKEKIKEKWVKALRSGSYNQIPNHLRFKVADGSYSYCCLGVLTDLYVIEKSMGLDFEWSESSYLSEDVMEWSGVSTEDGEVKNPWFDRPSLASLNDSEFLPFTEIADVIDKNWETI